MAVDFTRALPKPWRMPFLYLTTHRRKVHPQHSSGEPLRLRRRQASAGVTSGRPPSHTQGRQLAPPELVGSLTHPEVTGRQRPRAALTGPRGPGDRNLPGAAFGPATASPHADTPRNMRLVVFALLLHLSRVHGGGRELRLGTVRTYFPFSYLDGNTVHGAVGRPPAAASTAALPAATDARLLPPCIQASTSRLATRCAPPCKQRAPRPTAAGCCWTACPTACRRCKTVLLMS